VVLASERPLNDPRACRLILSAAIQRQKAKGLDEKLIVIVGGFEVEVFTVDIVELERDDARALLLGGVVD
jgi:uncharacterized ferredoxin-like protein